MAASCVDDAELDDPLNIELVKLADGREVQRRKRTNNVEIDEEALRTASKKHVNQLLREGLNDIAVAFAQQMGIIIPPERLVKKASAAGRPRTAPIKRTLPIVMSDEEDVKATTSKVTLDKPAKKPKMLKLAEQPAADTTLSAKAKGKRKQTDPITDISKKRKVIRPMALLQGKALLVKCPTVPELIDWLSSNREALFDQSETIQSINRQTSESEQEGQGTNRRNAVKRRRSSGRLRATPLFKDLKVVCLVRNGATRPVKETMALCGQESLIMNLIRGGALVTEQIKLRKHVLNIPHAAQHTTHIFCFQHAEKLQPWTMAEVLAELGLSSESDLFEQIDATTELPAKEQIRVLLAPWIGQCVLENSLVPTTEYEIARESENQEFEQWRRDTMNRTQTAPDNTRNFLPTRTVAEASSESESSDDTHESGRPNPLPAVSEDQGPIELDSDDQDFLEKAKRDNEVTAKVAATALDTTSNAHFDFAEFIAEAKQMKDPVDPHADGKYVRPEFDPDFAEELLEAPDVDRKSLYEDENMILSTRDQHASDGDSDDQDIASTASPKKSKTPKKKWPKRVDSVKYQCERPNEKGSRSDGINEDICKILSELKDRYAATPGCYWREVGMQKVIGRLRNSAERIDTYEKAMSLPNVSDSTAKKIAEICKTGKLRRIKAMADPEDFVRWSFQNIYGVGPKVAQHWFNRGARSLTDLAENNSFGITLSTSQALGLRYYADLLKRIPRDEVKEIFDKIKAVALEIDPKLDLEVMGSYRRGQADCGDIDIVGLILNNYSGWQNGRFLHVQMMTRKIIQVNITASYELRSRKGVLPELCKRLFEMGLMKHTLSSPHDWDAPDAKFMGLCALPGGLVRHIDILCVPADELGAALIYFTGNDIFNRSLRLKARKMGYSLNQKGVFKDLLRDRSSALKVTDGTRVAGRTEMEVFDLLKVPYYPPHQRLP